MPDPTNTALVVRVPLDATGVEEFKPDSPVKVVVAGPSGPLQSQIVKIGANKTGSATFKLPAKPRSLRVMVGPAESADDEIVGMQTLAVDVPQAMLQQNEVKLAPLVITPYFWHWWFFWCRTFTIRGRVLCPDGKPVPGAKVCAYDVDFWWWWFSQSLVGCATTDASGAFSLTFRWCCGFFPWWWFARRVWQLEPSIADRIQNAVHRNTKLRLPPPTPRPDLSIFEKLLAEGPTGQPVGPTPPQLAPVRKTVDPSALAGLRDKVLRKLPNIPELEKFKIWPWFPWQPWWDCTPDIRFTVTQKCNDKEQVIVQESFFDTHWEIPNPFIVTLVANDKACCVQGHDDPPGKCVVLSGVCTDESPAFNFTNIGGNFGATHATPRGFLNPQAPGFGADRPFAGAISIYGAFGTGAAVDYYEFEYSDDNGATWQVMPPGAAAPISRQYFGPGLFGELGLGPHTTPPISTTISGRNVIETRPHFEAAHGPGTWGVTHLWTSDWNHLFTWVTSPTLFADGTYMLRVRTWHEADLVGGADLTKSQLLPICDTQHQNSVVLTIDNRLEGPGSGHPLDHPCGSGTVHTCTTEPDTHFINVRLVHADSSETPLAACSLTKEKIKPTDQLVIDFYVHDPDGHLAYYELFATYGDSLMVPILGVAGSSLAAGAPYLAIPPAAQVGPDYGAARTQGAVEPIWTGGTIRLTIPAHLVFPETCCYTLVLRGHKRTIACGDGSFWVHWNLSEYAFMVTV